MTRRTVPKKWLRNASDALAVTQGCYFDADKGLRVCEFITKFCRQSKGSKWAGQPLVLLDWQTDFLMRFFGWRRVDGRRRFRRFYIEIAKKNGKTTLLAALQLYLLLADDMGPEIYINACDRNQASMMFEESKRMVEQSPDLRSRLVVKDSTRTIVNVKRMGFIRANSADAPNKDGLNPLAALFDELHRQPNRELWDVFEYAGAARDEPIVGSITTAGEDETGVWHEQRDYSEKVNEGVIPDVTHLGIVYRALITDDIDDPATWRKANPSLGVTIREDDFSRELAEAKELPVKLANFRRLRLNIIAREEGLYIPPDRWDACGDVTVPSMSHLGKRAYAGLDLSATTDLTAFALLVGDLASGFDLVMRFWLPEDNIVALEHRDNFPYRSMAERGFLILTPGDVIDYAFVRREINDVCEPVNLVKLLGDPWNATQLLTELRESDGLPVEQIRQGFQSLSAPTKELLRLILAKKIRHGGHPVLRWNAQNAVADTDAAGNVKLAKNKSKRKIDGMAALVNAVAAATGSDGEAGDSIYNTRGLMYL